MTVFDRNFDVRRAEQLNRDCQSVALDRQRLRQQLIAQPSGAALWRMICEERPHLLSEVDVFVAESSLRQQRDIIEAIERVIGMPAYQQRVLAYAPDAAQFKPRAAGVFLGYDFHLAADGPRLIEINTNAGGALIHGVLSSAHVAGKACGLDFPLAKAEAERAFVAMFQNEWRLEGHVQPLRTVAIVDETPDQQYLLPEFLLFQNLLAQQQIQAIICDPKTLRFQAGRLWHADVEIDLVYNRLTDFSLQEAGQQTLRAAYLAGAVVVTPHPRSHALYADKRNLALLTDVDFLQTLGLDADSRAVLLNGIAKTVRVETEDADRLWQQRKHWFFKPAKGYGGKAAYRGDKMTRRVFSEILQGDYVAQTLVQPSERRVRVDEQVVELKLDLRNYVYQGQVQSVCARLYQGQTTNFRTPGGGFAQVVAVPAAEAAIAEGMPLVAAF